MEPKSQGANSPPPKPWEQAGTSSGPAPFKPPSPGSTNDVVEASGTAKPGELVSNADRIATVNRNSLGQPLPTRPWEQNYGSNYGGYNSGINYNSGYGSGAYGSYGGIGGAYGGGAYGNSMYRGGYGGLYGGSGMYGGGMYNGGLGGPMGGYGMGMGGPFGDQDPNNPFGAPSSPPGFWISFLRVMQGVVSCFGRISILIDQNTQAFHMFMTALLQALSAFEKNLRDWPITRGSILIDLRHYVLSLSPNAPFVSTFKLFDRSGMLYGELARFVLRLLGIRTKPRKVHPPGSEGLQGPHNLHGGQKGLKSAPTGSWDSVWADDAGK